MEVRIDVSKTMALGPWEDHVAVRNSGGELHVHMDVFVAVHTVYSTHSVYIR